MPRDSELANQLRDEDIGTIANAAKIRLDVLKEQRVLPLDEDLESIKRADRALNAIIQTEKDRGLAAELKNFRLGINLNEQQIRQLIESNNGVIRHAYDLQTELQKKLKSLPTTKEFEQQRKDLTDKLNEMSEILTDRASLQRQLINALNLIVGVKEGNKTIVLSDTMFIDHPYEKLKDLFAPEHFDQVKELGLLAQGEEIAESDVTQATLNIKDKQHRITYGVPDLHVREYFTNVNAKNEGEMGSYVEIIPRSYPSDNFARQHAPDKNFNINKFPTGSDSAKVEFALNFAFQLLNDFTEAPTAKNPVIVRGNPEEMRFIWTALMIYGKETNMKFGSEAIKVLSPGFDPKKELASAPMLKKLWSRDGKFSNSSCYKTCFENEPVYRTLVDRINEANKEALGSTKVTSRTDDQSKKIKESISRLRQDGQKTPQQLKEPGEERASSRSPRGKGG